MIRKLLLSVCLLILAAACTPDAAPSPTAEPQQEAPTAAPTDAPAIEATSAPEPQPAEAEPPAGPVCPNTPNSLSGGEAMRMVFTNSTSGPLDVMYKDEAGQESFLFSLQPGESVGRDIVSGEAYCFTFPLGGLGLNVEPTMVELDATDEPAIETVFSDADHELAELALYGQPECRLRSRSTSDLSSFDVNFTNASNRAVTVYWIDWDGVPTEDPFELAAGETALIEQIGDLQAWCARDRETGAFVYQNFTMNGTSDFIIPSAGMNEAVTLVLSLESYCREGPGPNYPEVGVISAGELFYVVGIPGEKGYPWVVVLDNKVGATCWVWTEHATIEGALDQLPEYPIPPAP